ncbi:protein of unknown function [Nonlabens sp. Hel1_33_55]|uniref:DUF4270 domain-containing protein n=1 Tax=Nonlabens sp. Hel1_33_55 TaxID=1336802 RepID=UPI000875CB66|nr:DUF4270 domain-containing protein [Nonlabens sp. Hel1_33_55]SCY35550.1 protein of unknown function [Nonlabens sp. Hel1_33_55]
MKNLLKYGTMVIAIVFVLISCDTDPTELGSGFLGIDIDNTIIEEDFEVTAYSARLNPVQTNNFGSVQFGRYQDPIYGTSTHDFVTQLSLNGTGIDFSQDAEFESVILEIPYFSTPTGVDGEVTTYELDSIYGSGTVDFQIFENNFFLNSFDPNDVEQSAAYYSDLGDQVDDIKGDPIEFLNDIVTVQNFRPSNQEIIIQETEDEETTVVERLSPRLRLSLEPSFWRDLLVDDSGVLRFSSDSQFQNAFRGLYFKVTDDDIEGNLSYLNLSQARIVISYISKFQDINDTNGNGDTEEILNVDSTYEISIRGNRAVFVSQDIPDDVEQEIENSYDPVNGSDRLYLKGGPGAVSFIDLFGPDLVGGVNGGPDGVADQLSSFMDLDVLINEASLDIFVDDDAFTSDITSAEPENIVLYDPVDRTIVGVGILQRDDTTNKGLKYNISLTQYITSILNGTTENRRLSLSISQNLNSSGVSRVKDQTQPLQIENIPTGSAVSPEGTVLYGNVARTSEDPEKRLKLKIFYTVVN